MGGSFYAQAPAQASAPWMAATPTNDAPNP